MFLCFLLQFGYSDALLFLFSFQSPPVLYGVSRLRAVGNAQLIKENTLSWKIRVAVAKRIDPPTSKEGRKSPTASLIVWDVEGRALPPPDQCPSHEDHLARDHAGAPLCWGRGLAGFIADTH